MKQCNTCLVVKDDSDFRKKKRGNVCGLNHECKQCNSVKDRYRYSNETQERRNIRITKAKEWRSSNRDLVNALKRKYRIEKKIIKLSSMPHDNHVRIYHLYKEKQLKKFLLKHDHHVKEWKSSSARMYKWSYKHNINTMLYAKLKRGIYRSLGCNASYSNWSKHLNYTIDELRIHIESQFANGMSWENRHSWHIDHIVPVCAFDIQSVDSKEFKACFSLRNLRPIWPDDNRDKYWSVDRVFNKKRKQHINVVNQ